MPDGVLPGGHFHNVTGVLHAVPCNTARKDSKDNPHAVRPVHRGLQHDTHVRHGRGPAQAALRGLLVRAHHQRDDTGWYYNGLHSRVGVPDCGYGAVPPVILPKQERGRGHLSRGMPRGRHHGRLALLMEPSAPKNSGACCTTSGTRTPRPKGTKAQSSGRSSKSSTGYQGPQSTRLSHTGRGTKGRRSAPCAACKGE